MIYLFHGSDTDAVRKKAFAWIAAARAKEPNLAYIRLGKDEMGSAALAEAASSGSLFVVRLLVMLDDPYADAISGEAFEDALPMLAKSDNAIVVLAPKLAASRAKKISAVAKKTYAFDAREKKERGFNTALVNALTARDGAKLWTEVVRALAAGDAPEMLHGLLHWKARDLMQRGSRAWRPDEARALSLALLELPRQSRAKGVDMGRALERFALSL